MESKFKRYDVKVPIVYACRWTPEIEHEAVVLSDNGYDKQYAYIRHEFYAPGHEGESTGEIGDYLILVIGKGYHFMPAREFEKTFQA